MKILQASVTNFGSYDRLDFDFNDRGLALVHGPTGSGKSTLQDIPAWILFGVTAKDGAVDEVRSWFSPEGITEGTLEVETADGNIEITRVRGKASENDLYWYESGIDQKMRGKDIKETQKLLNERLGVDTETYLAGAYFHEFSATGNFFSAKASARRDLFQGLCELRPATELANRAKSARGPARALLASNHDSLNLLEGRLGQLLEQIEAAKDDGCDWEKRQARVIKEAQAKAESFEADQAEKIEALITQIEGLDHLIAPSEPLQVQQHDLLQGSLGLNTSEKCQLCGAARTSEARLAFQKKITDLQGRIAANQRLIDRRESVLKQLGTLHDAENHWLKQTDAERARPNPYHAMEDKARAARVKVEADYHKTKAEVGALGRRVDALQYLQDLSASLRAELLRAAVQSIEAATNTLLEKHFDAELKVQFLLEGDDNLQVEIQKSGYPCTYRQLSKGQRQLLKLTFSVAVMGATADKAGAHFDTLMFDEALDGLDSDLKVKAFDLFQELATSHGTVLLIDHAPELQNLFTNRFKVSLNGDKSQIEAQDGET